MERREGVAAITNTLLLLLLSMLPSGTIPPMPPHEDEGLGAYLQLLWSLWELVESPKIRFARAVVVPSTRSVFVWLAFGIAVLTRCFVLASRGVLKILRGAWVTTKSALAEAFYSGLWAVYAVAVTVGFMALIGVLYSIKVMWTWLTEKTHSAVEQKKA